MITTFLKKFERAVILSLILLMIVVVLISTLELFYIIIKDIISPPAFWLEIQELLDIFGFFLLILIGIELLETIKAYLAEKISAFGNRPGSRPDRDHPQGHHSRRQRLYGLAIIGIAALIASIAIAFYFLKKMIQER